MSLNSYGLRHLAAHLCELGQLEQAVELVTGEEFVRGWLELSGGVHEPLADLHRVREACLRSNRPDLAEQVARRLDELRAGLRGIRPESAESDRESGPEEGYKLSGDLALSPDRVQLACGADDGRVRVWEVLSAVLLLELPGHEGLVQSVAYAPDGRRLASAAWDRTVRVWDTQSEVELLCLRGHEGAVLSVAYAPDGRRLASASSDKTVRVWDAGTGAALACLRGHLSAVTGVYFCNAGEQAVSVAADGTVRVWDVDSGGEGAPVEGEWRWAGSRLEELAWTLQALKQVLFESADAGRRDRAGRLLRQIARHLVLDRIQTLETRHEPEQAIPVLDETVSVLPDESALAVRLASALAEQRQWSNLYRVLDRARLLDLTLGQKEVLDDLERLELTDYWEVLPAEIPPEQLAEVQARLLVLGRRFRHHPVYCVLECRFLAASIEHLAEAAGGADLAVSPRLERLTAQYRVARQRYHSLDRAAHSDDLNRALEQTEEVIYRLTPWVLQEQLSSRPGVRQLAASAILAQAEAGRAHLEDVRPRPAERATPGLAVHPGSASLQTGADLLEALRRYRILEREKLDSFSGDLQRDAAEARALARELLGRNWLTPYQANQLLQGRGAELVVGPYVLLSRVGQGGMGQVFQARHQRLGRVVALKVIREETLESPEVVRRFRRETRATAQLSHPNIRVVFDAGEDNGRHYFAMEYVEGTDLGKLIERGPLPVDEACEYVRQAALGLQHAHEAGLVHRDVKPQNLLLTDKPETPGGPRVVKVLDLGLVRLKEAADQGQESVMLTQSGTVIGTPDYIAPEQAVNSRQADIRSDVYSLGCTFYHLLTGRAPFAGGTLAQKLAWHLHAPPKPIEEQRPGLPPEVGAIVRKMMAKRPEDRYQTPLEVAQDLAALSGKEVAPALTPETASWTDTVWRRTPSKKASDETRVGAYDDTSLPRPYIQDAKVETQTAQQAETTNLSPPSPTLVGGKAWLVGGAAALVVLALAAAAAWFSGLHP